MIPFRRMWQMGQGCLLALFITLPMAWGDIPEHFGVHVHCLHPQTGAALVSDSEWAAIEADGFHIVRLDLLRPWIDRGGSDLDFSRYDPIITQLEQHHLRPMAILGLNQLPSSPADLDYAEAVVRHYRGRHFIWELSNEPNQQSAWNATTNPHRYMAMVAQVMPRLRQADPGGYFVAPATAGVPKGFLGASLRQGLLNQVDAIAIHPYQVFYRSWPHIRPPETLNLPQPHHNPLAWQELQQRIAQTGPVKPIVLGEWGVPTSDVDEQTQARYLVRQLLLGALYGTPANILYTWKGTITGVHPQAESTRENSFGILDNKLHPKAAYGAIQTLSQTLTGTDTVQRIPTASPQDYLLRFSGPTKTVIAAWTIGSNHTVNIAGHPTPLSGAPQFQVQAAGPD